MRRYPHIMGIVEALRRTEPKYHQWPELYRYVRDCAWYEQRPTAPTRHHCKLAHDAWGLMVARTDNSVFEWFRLEAELMRELRFLALEHEVLPGGDPCS